MIEDLKGERVRFLAFATEKKFANMMIQNGIYLSSRGRFIKNGETFIVLSKSWLRDTYTHGTIVEFIGMKEPSGEIAVWDLPSDCYKVVE